MKSSLCTVNLNKSILHCPLFESIKQTRLCSIHLLMFTVAFFAATIFSPILAQNTVFISSKEVGRGIIKERDGEFFVITPKHVVDDNSNSAKIVGEKNISSTSTLVQTYAVDIAILRIEGGGKQPYNDWSIREDFNAILDRSSSAFVEYREIDGTVKIGEVSITEKTLEIMTVKPRDRSFSFAKGWSGSALFVKYGDEKVFLGMLTDIVNGDGIVLRADYMMNVASGFFDKKKPNPVPKSSLGNLMTNQVKMNVTKFEQNRNKAIFYFTLENINPSTQLTHYATHPTYHKLIDQNGITYAASQLQYGNGGAQVDLVYKVPVSCFVEFEVGSSTITKASLLELNAYNYEFKFFNMQISGQAEIRPKEAPLVRKEMAKLIDKQILMTFNGFEQNGNKAIFHFSITNRNPTQQLVRYETHPTYHKLIDQNGNTYSVSELRYGNQGTAIDLIYNVPTQCFAVFDVGASKITKAALLQLNAYNYAFPFVNIPLVEEFKAPTPTVAPVNPPPSQLTSKTGKKNESNAIGSINLNGVVIEVVKFEQIANKFICHYSLLNKDPKSQVKPVSSHSSYIVLEANGYKFNCSHFELGNAGSETTLVLNTPVSCYAEFDVGAVRISKITSLNLSLYNFDFRFTGRGDFGAPNSLKSTVAIEQNKVFWGEIIKSVTQKQ
jgi:hypothetical protein